MMCEVCQTENATVHLTQIISGKMRKADLCVVCVEVKKRTFDIENLAFEDWIDFDQLPDADNMLDFSLLSLVSETH